MLTRMNLDSKSYRTFKQLQLLIQRLNEEEPEAIRQAAFELKEMAEAGGIRSANIYWALACAFDVISEPELGLGAVCEAVRIDSFHILVFNGFEKSMGALAGKLRAPRGAMDDALIRRVYETLQQAGVARVEAHVAMAGCHLRQGKLDEAMAVAEAATQLFPGAPEALEMKAAIARARGQAGGAPAAAKEGDD